MKSVSCPRYFPSQIKLCVLSVLTVALALVPEATAFAFVAHVHRLVGLCAAFIVGLITAVFGGCPGMISGATGALTMAIIYLLPRLTHAIPSALAGIVAVSLLVILAGVDTKTVGDMASIEGGLPLFHLPAVPFTWDTLQIIFPYSLILAACQAYPGQLSVESHGWKAYEFSGTLFIASSADFLSQFTLAEDSDEVVIDFARARAMDHSAVEAIDGPAERYRKAGKRLHLRHLSPDCLELMSKAKDMVEIDVREDPHYRIADDKLG